MYTIYASTAVFVVLAFIAFYRFKSWLKGDKVCAFFAIIGAPAFISFVIGCVIMGLYQNIIPCKYETATYELASMRAVNSVHGQFVWGTGSFNGVLTYDVYVKNANGSVSPYRISAYDLVEINEKSDLKDVGYWKRTVRKNDYSTWVGNWVFQHPDAETLVKTELDVPTGTVVHNFTAQ